MADIFIPQNSAFRSTLPTGTNLDNVKDKGVYSLSSNNTYTNNPVAYGTLEVISGVQANDTFLLQRVTSSTGVWSRFFTGSVWQPWYFASGALQAPTDTTGILHYALNTAPHGVTVVSHINISTNQSPNVNYANGEAIIIKRGTNSGIQVFLSLDGSIAYPIVKSACNSGTWTGWEQIITSNSIHTVNNGTNVSFEASTWKYTGVSVVIPAHSIYCIRGTASYNASKPNYSLFSSSTTTQNSSISGGGTYNGVCAGCVNTGYTTTSSSSFYLWAQYNSAGSNDVSVSGWYITYG